ncbi:unnamed protein product, partial [Mesorhabditis belari]|uniref:Uncharacterized protein n=1 Tax=Mesorhabditis belari TaxID=2138241 RepID=A0AAF3J9M2_9BILA
MIFKSISCALFLGVLVFSNSASATYEAFAAPAAQALEIIAGLTQEFKVLVTNTATASIFLKCASADDAITGDGSDSDDWWTLQPGDALGWNFGSSAGGRTCFWCYANSNDQAARDSGNWYIHQNVWGLNNFDDCPGTPGQTNEFTYWEIRNDGAYADDGDGDGMKKYSDWGAPPS